MRRFWFIPFLCVFLLLGIVSTLSTTRAATAGGKTQVVTDEQAHVVRVIIDGKEVLLCWRNDEERIKFYHDADAGYAGRKPLKEGL